MSLSVEGDASTRLLARINGQEHQLLLGDLLTGSRTFYMGGFVSPAVCYHRAVPKTEYTHKFSFLHHGSSKQRDWYYIRLRQLNNQWAWSSPIWVGP
jgi:hypothetical protein